jgi:hypothetical protein
VAGGGTRARVQFFGCNFELMTNDIKIALWRKLKSDLLELGVVATVLVPGQIPPKKVQPGAELFASHAQRVDLRFLPRFSPGVFAYVHGNWLGALFCQDTAYTGCSS